jgi:uncharacterized protein YjbJ (UPF0337 family)
MEAARTPATASEACRVHFHTIKRGLERERDEWSRALMSIVCTRKRRRRNEMNADQLKGRWMQFKGELKEKWGKFTDNDLTEIEGNYEKFVGKVQERYGDKKSELMKWAEAWLAKPATKAEGKKNTPVA